MLGRLLMVEMAYGWQTDDLSKCRSDFRVRERRMRERYHKICDDHALERIW